MLRAMLEEEEAGVMPDSGKRVSFKVMPAAAT